MGPTQAGYCCNFLLLATNGVVLSFSPKWMQLESRRSIVTHFKKGGLVGDFSQELPNKCGFEI